MASLVPAENGPRVLYREGDIIMTEIAWIYVLYESTLAKHCNKCLLEISSTASLMRCAGCKMAQYCSKTCQTDDWKYLHKEECSVYGSDMFRQKLAYEKMSEGIDGFLMPLLKVLLKLKKEKAGPDHPFFQLPSLATDAFKATLNRVFHFYEPLVRYVDKDRKLCPNQAAFAKIAGQIDRHMMFLGRRSCVEWLCNGLGRATHECTIGNFMLVNVNIKYGRGCVPNVFLIQNPRDHDQRNIAVMASRDIRDGEKIESMSGTFFATTAERQKVLAGKQTPCVCCACTDKAFEAERYGLRCRNPDCTAVIPSDQRACLPCKKCGTRGNNEQLDSAKPIIANMLQLFNGVDQLRSASFVSRLVAVAPLVAWALESFHPSNLLLGIAYMQLANAYAFNGQEKERVEYLEKAITVGETQLGRIHPACREEESLIIDYYLRHGPKYKAMEWLRKFRYLNRVTYGPDSKAFQMFEVVWNGMNKFDASYETYLRMMGEVRVRAEQQ